MEKEMSRFCTQCGATVNQTARFCNKCGVRLMPGQPEQSGESPAMTYQAPPSYQERPGYEQPPYPPSNQTPYRPPAAEADLKPNMAGMLCYPLSFITGILFLVLTPYNKDAFVRFHAYQSIFFFVAMLALNIILGVLSWFMPWYVDNLLSAGMRLLALGGTGWLMYQAYQGNKFKLPVIGEMAENQASKP
jgi:uncharacterized membrane protein